MAISAQTLPFLFNVVIHVYLSPCIYPILICSWAGLYVLNYLSAGSMVDASLPDTHCFISC